MLYVKLFIKCWISEPKIIVYYNCYYIFDSKLLREKSNSYTFETQI